MTTIDMPHNPSPRAFRTKDWRQLYASHILDLATLKTVASGAVFVVIDAEPWGADDFRPAELGVTLLPGRKATRLSARMPRTLDGISDLLQLATHWIRVNGRERRENFREMHRFGQRHAIEDGRVEEVISDIIQVFKGKHHREFDETIAATERPLILAGFSLDFEFRVLSSLYPNLLRHFTSWLDLQEIAKEVSSDSKGVLTSPGLHETLFACGFDNGFHSTRLQHNAATDTVRAAAVFAYLMAWHSETDILDTSVSSRRPNQRRNYRRIPPAPGQNILWHGVRPKPKEFYPYGARVSRVGQSIDLDVQDFFDLFAATHVLAAAGVSNGKRYGWVCLPDMEALQTFSTALMDQRLVMGTSGRMCRILIQL